jgi:hypothetical protein
VEEHDVTGTNRDKIIEDIAKWLCRLHSSFSEENFDAQWEREMGVNFEDWWNTTMSEDYKDEYREDAGRAWMAVRKVLADLGCEVMPQIGGK